MRPKFDCLDTSLINSLSHNILRLYSTNLLNNILKGGVVTAGSASGICDGAAAVVVASEAAVKKHNLTPLARWGSADAAVQYTI